MIGLFVSFYLFFRKCFTLPALGCVIFNGNKSTTSEVILQNSDGDRRPVELIEGCLDRSEMPGTKRE